MHAYSTNDRIRINSTKKGLHTDVRFRAPHDCTLRMGQHFARSTDSVVSPFHFPTSTAVEPK